MYRLIALLGLLPLLSLTGYLAAGAYLFRATPASEITEEFSEIQSRRVEPKWLAVYQSTSNVTFLTWLSNEVARAGIAESPFENANNLTGKVSQLQKDWLNIQTFFASISEVAAGFHGLPESDAFNTNSIPDLELPFTKIASRFIQSTETPKAPRIKLIEEQILRVGSENKNRVLERERLANNESLMEYARSVLTSQPVDWISLSNRLREGFRGSLTLDQTRMLTRSELSSDLQETERHLLEAKEIFSQKDLTEERKIVQLLSQADSSLHAAQAKLARGDAVSLSEKTEIDNKLQLLIEMRSESTTILERLRSNNAVLEETLAAIKADESPNWKELQKRAVSKWQGELSPRGEQLILRLGLHSQLKDLDADLARLEALLQPESKASLPDLDEELRQYEENASRFQRTFELENRLGLTDRQEIDDSIAKVEARYRNLARVRQELGVNLDLITVLIESLAVETADIPALRERLSVGWKGEKRPELIELSFRLEFREQLQTLAKELKSVEEAAAGADLSWGTDVAQPLDNLTAGLSESRIRLNDHSPRHPDDERFVNKLSDQLEQLRMKQAFWCSWQDSNGEVKAWLEKSTGLIEGNVGSSSAVHAKSLFPKIVESCLSIKESKIDDEIRFAISANGKYYEGVFIPMENYYRFWPEIELYRKTPETGFERKPRNFFKTEPAIPPEARLVIEYNEARANLLENVLSKENWSAFLGKLEELQLETERYAGKQKKVHYLEEIRFCKDLLGSWEQAQLFLR
jgi:hypothetical protein